MHWMTLELWDFSFGDLVKDILKAITGGACSELSQSQSLPIYYFSMHFQSLSLLYSL